METGVETGVSRAAPSDWLCRYAGAAPAGAVALDLACGAGRQGRYLLARGHPVLFCDRDLSGLTDLRGQARAWPVRADLERWGWPFAAGRFGLVVVANYLWRPLLPDLFAAVAPGGLLLYETFMAGQERFGRPTNPDFLLRPGELRDACPTGYLVLDFQQGEVASPRPAMRQCLAARRAA